MALEDDIWIHQQAYISLGYFNSTTKTTYTLKQSNHGIYILVIKGSVLVANESLQHRDAVGLWETPDITMTVAENSRVLIVEVPMN
jgi:redox-sensitive bicupin YhaK (pirin superfamily)